MKVKRSIIGFIDEDWCVCKKCSKKTMGKTINQISVDGTTNFWYCESCTEEMLKPDGVGPILGNGFALDKWLEKKMEAMSLPELTEVVWESATDVLAKGVGEVRLADPYVKHRLYLQAIGKETEGGSEATQPDPDQLIIRVDAPMDCDDTVCRDADGAYENIVKHMD